jgi:hypothetical protein
MFIRLPIEIEISESGWMFRMELEQLPIDERDGFHRQFVTNLITGCVASSGQLPEFTTTRDGSMLCTQTPWLNIGLGALLDALLAKLPTGIAVGAPAIRGNQLAFDLVIDVVAMMNQNRLIQTAQA